MIWYSVGIVYKFWRCLFVRNFVRAVFCDGRSLKKRFTNFFICGLLKFYMWIVVVFVGT